MTYFTQSVIADDPYMRLRVASAAAQQGVADAGAGIDPDSWTLQWRRVWSASPGWDLAWESAQANGIPNPGMNDGVITDGMILSQVQAMMPFIEVSDNQPEMNPLAQASREFVMHQVDPLSLLVNNLKRDVDQITGKGDEPPRR
jgi:hypothetical protein